MEGRVHQRENNGNRVFKGEGMQPLKSCHQGRPPAPALVNLLGNHFKRCRRLVSLENRGKTIAPKAYILTGQGNDGPAVRPSNQFRYEKILSYSRNEPRLELIKRSLERMARLGRFSGRRRLKNCDGFRLSPLDKWAGFPVGLPEANFPSISSYCNCDCEFCYERGTRQTPILSRLGRKNLSLQEAKTRLRYYSRETQNGLVPGSYLALEAFLNPHCLKILEHLHAAHPDDSIRLTTNGGFLTVDVVSRLARLKPILILVSLNAATVEMRQMFMHERPAPSSQVALDSFALLKKYKIAAEGSYVPWPGKPLSDMEEAIRHMDSQDVVRVRVCLPSFTRYHGLKEPFDTPAYWMEILSVVARLRREVCVPIDVVPNSYEFRTSRPIVHGAVKNSPAAKAGIRFGDRIVAIDGQKIYTVTEMHGLLAQRAGNDALTRTVFKIERKGKTFDIEIPHPADIAEEDYPFCSIAKPGGSRWANSLGIHYTGGFPLTNIVRLLEVCREYRGRRILLFTSEFMKPHFLEALDMVEDAAEILKSVELYVDSPIHRFWGGNVMIGDLWMIPDLIAQTKRWMDVSGVRPDVVVAASSFLSVGKRDLIGHCYLEFERQLDIELRLIPCASIIE